MFAIISTLLISIQICTGSNSPPEKRHRFDELGPIKVSEGLSIAGISANGRVIEAYNWTEISRVYGDFFARALRNQTRSDEFYDRLTPVGNDHGLSEVSPVGRFLLGRKISSSKQSVVFEIQGNPNLLVKYQANCNELDPETRVSETHYVHPLFVDGIFGNIAAKVGVGPRIHYLSPPGPLCRTKEGRCEFGMASEDFEKCLITAGASLRFMIIHKVQGVTLAEFQKRFQGGIAPLSAASLIGNGIMNLLEKLHGVGRIVHGDIHSHNIILESLDTGKGTVSLKLIDYGKSFFNSMRKDETVREFGWASHYRFSSWELEGFDPAPRDDVERTLQIVAQLMMPQSYIETEKRYAFAGASAIHIWKKFGNLFIEPSVRDHHGSGGFDPVVALNVPEEYREKIRTNLDLLLELVRGMNDINTTPPYSHFKEGLRLILELVMDGDRAVKKQT